MKIAVIGQSLFGQKVYELLRENGHEVVGVFTVPDKNGREDVLATKAAADGIKVFKYPRWRLKGAVIPEVLAEYLSVGAELNVLPFCTQYIPMEVIAAPAHESIIYHPSLLPKHRGASAISWTLIEGDAVGGFSIFYADHGLDTGPILLQKEVTVDPDDTLNSLYRRFMMPEGIKAMGEAVELIASGKAVKRVQPEEGASYEAHITAKPELAEIDWAKSGAALHNFIRGCDKVPGAWSTVDGKQVKFFGSKMWVGSEPEGAKIPIAGMHGGEAIVHANGLLLRGSDGVALSVANLEVDGRAVAAAKFGQADAAREALTLSEEEATIKAELMSVWKSILNAPVSEDTDFFKSGAGSMDVTRLVEEVKDKCGGLELENEDVYQGPSFGDFIHTVITKRRSGGGGGPIVVEYKQVKLNVNNMDLTFPYQLFIDGAFADSASGNTYNTINPADESVICAVAKGCKADVDRAVAAAKAAMEGDWGRMNARDRGKILFKLADLMEEHKEELATLESIDSGAVYTLALKTHIGMSIDTWRYFAGWCDKIQAHSLTFPTRANLAYIKGTTIPINHARPNRNLTITKKEPIGVCALMAACLAAGNTVIHKPAQVSPLTALKFAELSAMAGVPKGVINILPGSGREIGQLMADHPDVRKIGFTGSTPVGATIMKSAAVSNIKKCSLELGGKSPLIIFADAELDKAVRQACGAVFFNKGENCIAAGRLFVAEEIHDAFLARVVEEVSKMTIGDPLNRGTAHGPQNHRAHLEKLVAYCERGVKEGAKLIRGGKQVERPGLFFEPTIFTDVGDDNYIAIEESFGPVMIISTFRDDDMDGVLRRANRSEYGLASGVFSKDVSRVLRVAELLDAGTVFVNCYNKTDVAAPFGGFKQSGFGKDLGEQALNEYLKSKTITFEY